MTTSRLIKKIKETFNQDFFETAIEMTEGQSTNSLQFKDESLVYMMEHLKDHSWIEFEIYVSANKDICESNDYDVPTDIDIVNEEIEIDIKEVMFDEEIFELTDFQKSNLEQFFKENIIVQY